YTSSTVNAVDVNVVNRQTVEVAFGDIAPQNVQFQEISLGNTQNALSLTTIDTGEDSKNDLDLVLGTHYVGGSNDVLVWWNARTNSNTPNSGIFPQAPSYSRVVAYDVNSIGATDLNGDGNGDIVTVLGTATNDINVWQMQTGGNKGRLPVSPNANYTASTATGVYDIAIGKCDNDSYKDLVIGSYLGDTTGKIEVWHGSSNGTSFTRATKDLMAVLPGPGTAVGAVHAVALADFDHDGHAD